MKPTGFILLLAASIVSSKAAMGAQANGLPTVPSGLSPELTARLNNERARLVSEGHALQVKVEKHHAECAYEESAAEANQSPKATGHSPLPVDTMLLARCEAEQPQIHSQTRSFAAASAKYRKDVDDAIAAAVGHNAYSARVVLKGGVELIQPAGRAANLTSSRVVVLSSGERVVTSKHARASFAFSDATNFIVGPEAEVVFEKLVNNSNPTLRQFEIRLVKGTMRWVSTASSNIMLQNVLILVPSANVTVQGGQLQASVSPSGDGYIAAQKGSVVVSPTKSGFKVTLTAGEVVTFSAAGVFATPQRLQPKQIQFL